MTPEQMEDEIEQLNTWMKESDAAISELREKVKALSRFCEQLLVAGFQRNNHSKAGDDAVSTMAELVRQVLTP
jgi:hypothetical protein